jgi:hypothetical protein
MDFVRAQPKGIATPCCDSNGCTKPSTKYSCGAGQALQLCVVNGAAAECVDPASNDICSGNFTAAVVSLPGSTVVLPPSGPTSGTGPTTSQAFIGGPGNTALSSSGTPLAATQTSTTGHSNSTPSSSGHSGLSQSSITAIATVIPLIVAIVGLLVVVKKCLRTREKGE